LNLRPLIPNLRQTAATESQNDVSDREIIERFVERIVINPQSIEIQLRDSTTADQITEVETFAPATNMAASIDEETATIPAVVISVPWSAPAFVSVKGVLHWPSGKAMLKPETRDAIVKTRTWVGDLASGLVRSFAEIAQHEERWNDTFAYRAPRTMTIFSRIDRRCGVAVILAHNLS